jgi:hypothetical protein
VIGDLVYAVQRSLKRKGIGATLKLCALHLYYLATRRSRSATEAAEEEAEFDERYGVDTRAEVVPRRLTVDDQSLVHGNRYGTILPHEFHEIFKQFKLNHEDFVFVDLGSGKGRVLMLAADYPFAKVVGVEYALELHQTAEANLRKYKGESQKCFDVQSMHMDATQFEFPEKPVFLYMANPFDGHVMSKVMANLEATLQRNPRPFVILYVNPVEAELVRSTWSFRTRFSRLERIPRYEFYQSESPSSVDVGRSCQQSNEMEDLSKVN